jgi:uncharacterized protein
MTGSSPGRQAGRGPGGSSLPAAAVGPVNRDDATAEFFDGTAARQFLLRRCPDAHVSEPAAAQCSTCGRTDLSWVPASGGASLVSWTVTWPRAGGRAAAAPTVLVIAELDEGPWWWSQLAGADPAGLAVGDRLIIDFAAADDDHEAVPILRLAGA